MSRALVDVDGVCADFLPAVLAEAQSKLKPQDIVGWQVFDFIAEADGEEIARRTKRKLTDVGFWRGLGVVEGSKEFVARLREEFEEVYFVTAPWRSCKGWEFTRREWLKKHFGARPEHVIPTSAKHVIRGDFFIDDRFDAVQRWRKATPHGIGIVKSAAYNKGLDWTRCHEVLDWISCGQRWTAERVSLGSETSTSGGGL